VRQHIDLVVIGAASSAGAYGPGQERAPAVLRDHGLIDRLRATGLVVHDSGEVVQSTFRADPDHPDAGNVDEVRRVSQVLSGAVAAALASGSHVLVLGGDCTLELGTVAGAVADGATAGVIYIDLDGDLNTPATGDGICDWMGVAHLLGVPGTHPRLVELGGRIPLLSPEDVYLVAVDRLTEAEQALVEDLRLRRASLADVTERPAETVDRLRAWATSFDRILLHVDIDVLDYAEFPIAHEVRDVPGLAFAQLADLLRSLRDLPNWTALTVCEINPDHARAPEQFNQLAVMLADAVPRPGYWRDH
jgi:arginase